jgi:hypothetical protein
MSVLSRKKSPANLLLGDKSVLIGVSAHIREMMLYADAD